MKKSNLFQECKKLITPEIQRSVDISVDIANRILDILESKNMTQRQFAEKLGKSESEISGWLTGAHVFTTKTIAKIEVALGDKIINIKDDTRIPVVNISFLYKAPIPNCGKKRISRLPQDLKISFS